MKALRTTMFFGIKDNFFKFKIECAVENIVPSKRFDVVTVPVWLEIRDSLESWKGYSTYD